MNIYVAFLHRTDLINEHSIRRTRNILCPSQPLCGVFLTVPAIDESQLILSKGWNSAFIEFVQTPVAQILRDQIIHSTKIINYIRSCSKSIDIEYSPSI